MSSEETGTGIRRFEESGSPVFIIAHNIRKYCHHEVKEQTEDGDIIDLKIRPTQPFLVQLNERVYDLIEAAINSARQEGRTELMVQDVPTDEANEEDDDDNED